MRTSPVPGSSTGTLVISSACVSAEGTRIDRAVFVFITLTTLPEARWFHTGGPHRRAPEKPLKRVHGTPLGYWPA
jgi:hypothetical protein